jgi:uncharacterized protein involved in exopolysaccharide biosynthesis
MSQGSDLINVDFKELFTIIKRNRWFIILTALFFAVFILAYSLLNRKEYLSQGRLLPEIGNNQNVSQFAGLAAMAGVELGGSNSSVETIRPELYPDLLRSAVFFVRLFNEKISDSKGNELLFKTFYTKNVSTEIGNGMNIPSRLAQGRYIIKLDKQTEKDIEDLRKRIVCNYDKKSGLITISVRLPDPVVAACVADYCIQYLVGYVISYRTEKSKRELDFITERLALAKTKYFSEQNRKALYMDRMPSQFLRFQTADVERERIDADFKVSSNFYNTLLQKNEELKLKIQQDTPVIKVIDPPSVPNEPIRQNLVLSILLSIVVGLLVSTSVLILFKGRHIFY